MVSDIVMDGKMKGVVVGVVEMEDMTRRPEG